MFSEEQILFMKKLGLDFDFENLSDENYCEIEEVVGDCLTLQHLDEDYRPDREGLLCYSILESCREKPSRLSRPE